MKNHIVSNANSLWKCIYQSLIFGGCVHQISQKSGGRVQIYRKSGGRIHQIYHKSGGRVHLFGVHGHQKLNSSTYDSRMS